MAEELIRIGNTDLVPIEYKGERVVTFRMIDDCHERPEGTAKRNFSANRQHFIEGTDYFIARWDEIRTSENGISANAHGEAILITEGGYLMLCKSFTDALSWQVQRQLVTTYFRAKPAVDLVKTMIADPDWGIGMLTVIKEAQQEILLLEADNAALTEQNEALQVTASKYEAQTETDGTYTVGEIAKELGTSAVTLNRFLHKCGVQYKPNGSKTWELYTEHSKAGIAVTKLMTLDNGRTIPYLRWTPKGRDFISDLVEEKLPDWYAG